MFCICGINLFNYLTFYVCYILCILSKFIIKYNHKLDLVYALFHEKQYQVDTLISKNAKDNK